MQYEVAHCHVGAVETCEQRAIGQSWLHMRGFSIIVFTSSQLATFTTIGHHFCTGKFSFSQAPTNSLGAYDFLLRLLSIARHISTQTAC